MDVLLDVIKDIFCDELDEDKKSALCHLIDKGNLPSFKIIEPDGSFIKKDQILDLQYSFSQSNQFTKQNIYIIKNCEKMNKESANTMLKFLEEPNGEVLGFFITNSISNVIPTISSRCQKLDAIFEDDMIDITKEKYNEYYDFIKKYIRNIEVEKKDLILYNKDYLNELEKKEVVDIFKIILNIYQKALENKLTSSTANNDFKYLEKYTNDNLLLKINLIINVLKKLNYNVNTSLLVDSFVIEMDGINNESI